MFRVESLRIIPEESESAKDSQTSKDRTRQAAFVKAASNLADEAANAHCRLLACNMSTHSKPVLHAASGSPARSRESGFLLSSAVKLDSIVGRPPERFGPPGTLEGRRRKGSMVNNRVTAFAKVAPIGPLTSLPPPARPKCPLPPNGKQSSLRQKDE